MSTQTIFQAGNSNVISIPKYLQDELGLKLGQKVSLTKVDNKLVIEKAGTAKSAKNPSQFNKWWDVFIKENAEVLDDLAVR